ncbi:hypothetical protein KP509_38G041000 [Ceratopteris richardii]|nr:hypothetical protein KP509_38G041000 [Ceratopteris richardii]
MMCTHAIQSPVVIKATQQYANKDASAEEGPIAKPPLVRPAGSVKLPNRSIELKVKSSVIENHPERENLGRSRAVDSMICQRTLSEHLSSSDNLSENAMTPSHMEDFTFSDPGAGSPVMETILTGKDSKLLEGGSRMDDSVLVDDEDLFKYVLATRQIPYGHSYSSLGSSMQRRLHDHFKLACPPCPHCNSNTFVRFRYFNNSGKSSLLQPRYSCRNPHTCAIAQEKNGKTGSRDFTLPKPKEVEAQKALATFTVQEHVDTMIDRAACQPQMIARAGTKRSAQNASLSEAGERSGKLPNTTLSLQTLNEPTTVVQVPKTRALQQAGKHIEDSNSSSSIQTVNNEQTAINVRCQAETSSENGRIIVQPISVQKVVPYLGKGEVGTSAEGPSNPRKIAELNICMYIDLSSASQCQST